MHRIAKIAFLEIEPAFKHSVARVDTSPLRTPAFFFPAARV